MTTGKEYGVGKRQRMTNPRLWDEIPLGYSIRCPNSRRGLTSAATGGGGRPERFVPAMPITQCKVQRRCGAFPPNETGRTESPRPDYGPAHHSQPRANARCARAARPKSDPATLALAVRLRRETSLPTRQRRSSGTWRLESLNNTLCLQNKIAEKDLETGKSEKL